MSSPRPRLEVREDLLDVLDELDKKGQDYKNKHLTDGLYDGLAKNVREAFKDTHVDYVKDFANNYGLIRYLKKKSDLLAKEVESLKEEELAKTQYSFLQAGLGKNIRRPLERLLVEVGLFKQANGVEEPVLVICDKALKELEDLDKNSKQLMEMKV